MVCVLRREGNGWREKRLLLPAILLRVKVHWEVVLSERFDSESGEKNQRGSFAARSALPFSRKTHTAAVKHHNYTHTRGLHPTLLQSRQQREKGARASKMSSSPIFVPNGLSSLTILPVFFSLVWVDSTSRKRGGQVSFSLSPSLLLVATLSPFFAPPPPPPMRSFPFSFSSPSFSPSTLCALSFPSPRKTFLSSPRGDDAG